MRFIKREVLKNEGKKFLDSHPEIKDDKLFDRLSKTAKEFWIKDTGILGVKLGMNDYSLVYSGIKELIECLSYVEKDELDGDDIIEIPFFTHDEAVSHKKIMNKM